MAKQSKKVQEKVGKIMHEFKEGTLKSGKEGIGGTVTDRKQAIAIALSEAAEVEKKKTKKKEPQ